MSERVPSNEADAPNSTGSAPESNPPGDARAAAAVPETSAPGDSIPAASVESVSAGHNPFQSSALVFVFLRLCLYLVLAYYVLPRILRPLLPLAFSSFAPRILMAVELIFTIAAFAPAWLLAWLERRPFGDYGLPLRGAFGKLFCQGAVLGLIEISSVVGAMSVLGAYRFGRIAIHGQALLYYAVFWALFFLVVGLCEEFQYRGYVQFTLAQALGFWPAAVLLSVAFGLVHLGNSGENWVGAAGVALTGLLWCFTLRRTGSLWVAVGMHAAFDFGETFLYSVPDSGYVFPGHLSNAIVAGPGWLTGGSVGPEASVFDFVMLILFFFVIHRLYPARPVRSVEQAPPQA